MIRIGWSMLILVVTLMGGEIIMSPTQITQKGILTVPIERVRAEAMGPFVGSLEYSDQNAKSYVLSAEATVVQIYKRVGDSVQKGEAICTIASSDLLSSRYELADLRNRLRLAQEYARKDAALYRDGVISLRESQKSALDVMSLQTKIAQIRNSFTFAGADQGEGMIFTIRSKYRGVISDAPLNVGEKIEPFTPYIQVNTNQTISAVIKIPPQLIASIHKNDRVLDRNRRIVGKVIALSEGVNRWSNSAVLIARLDHSSDRVGMSSRFYIEAQVPHDWSLVPRSALSKYKGQDICFARTSRGFTPVVVSVQKLYADKVAITGINPQVRVVTEGIMILKGMLGGLGFE